MEAGQAHVTDSRIISMDVKLLDPPFESQWDAYVAQHDSLEVGIYHTLAWRDVAQNAFGHEPYYLTAIQDGEICGIMPLFLVKGILGKRLVSVPLRDRGAPLFDNQSVLEELMRGAEKLATKLGCTYIEFKSLSSFKKLLDEKSDYTETAYYRNMVIPLSNEPEQVWSNLHKKSVQWAIRKSRRDGVTSEWGNDLSDYKRFYELFLLTRRRLGVPPFSFNLFKSIHDHLAPRGMARLILGVHENRTVSGMILFYHKERIIEAYAASDDSAFKVRPNNLILWDAIEDGCKKGFSLYDFGATPPTNTGLLKFKKRWGAEETPIYSCISQQEEHEQFQRDGNGLALRAFRSAFRLLPVACTRKIGPFFANMAS